MSDLKVPTEQERTAHLLREQQGLSDGEIARITGCTRETACRRRQRYVAKMDRLRLARAQGGSPLDDLLRG